MEAKLGQHSQNSNRPPPSDPLQQGVKEKVIEGKPHKIINIQEFSLLNFFCSSQIMYSICCSFLFSETTDRMSFMAF
ncbi:hypothetical protein [Desulforhabdus sp. TSK]|uniref:hypothetical protein n=1 Tax=Desulforhabdus sp. TSK TaxID=2925014 RepID=UPI0034D7460E